MDDEQVRLITASFILGLRVSQNINNLPDPDAIRYAALLDILQRISAGEQDVLIDSAAELKRQRPDIQDLHEIRDNNELQQSLAMTLLQKMGIRGK